MARDIANMGLNVAVMNTKSLVAEIFSIDPAKRPGVQICKVLGRPNPEEYDRWNWIYHHWSEVKTRSLGGGFNHARQKFIISPEIGMKMKKIIETTT